MDFSILIILFLTGLGLGVIAAVAIPVLLILFYIKLIKKHPTGALTLAAILVLVSTIGLSNPATFVSSLSILMGLLGASILEYKKLAKVIK